MRYFKGHNKTTGTNMFFVVFDTPQKFFSEEHIVEAMELQQTGKKCYPTVEACEAENSMEREIGEGEYQTYIHIQHILTEIFMHDYTGGFPRMEKVNRLMMDLPYEIQKFAKEIKEVNNEIME